MRYFGHKHKGTRLIVNACGFLFGRPKAETRWPNHALRAFHGVVRNVDLAAHDAGKACRDGFARRTGRGEWLRFAASMLD